ncbi:MAG: nucleotidyltransferase domain-containing protein [Paludibacteraceae bacterium]|nr:nucleotidyltransferase domain-containing protein [Paludibacteraceae bacterium]
MRTSKSFISRLTMLGKQVLPGNASLWLYGSRAREDAHADSDWDILILLDKEQQDADDFGKYAYPLTLMAAKENQLVIPQIYTRKQWERMRFTPFVKNVEHDKLILV